MHVSLAGHGKMKVTWVTSSAVPATVQYGTTSRHYTNIASGVTKQYCFILYESGLIHDVILGPLKPSTTYFYKCGGFGAEFNFTTPPPSGPNVPIKFAVVGESFFFCMGFWVPPLASACLAFNIPKSARGALRKKPCKTVFISTNICCI